MKRNLDLIRNILIEIESFEGYRLSDDDFKSSDDLFDISYHLELLIDSNYVIGESYFSRLDNFPTKIFIQHDIYRLTNKGHDFLDSIRDDNIYKSVKDKATTVSKDLPLEVIKSIASSIILKKLGF